MKELLKKKGYELIVTSWENDADNYKTESMPFEELDCAKFVYELCLKFDSNNSALRFNPEKLGNVQFFRKGHFEKYQQALQDHITKLTDKYNVPVDYADFDYVDEMFLFDLIGTWDEGDQTRVVESVKLIFYPEDVYVDVIEIT